MVSDESGNSSKALAKTAGGGGQRALGMHVELLAEPVDGACSGALGISACDIDTDLLAEVSRDSAHGAGPARSGQQMGHRNELRMTLLEALRR